jgi:hypothetical protein
MNLKSLLRDRISLLKKDGSSRIDGIPASVQSDEILIMQTHPLIESGDLIVRSMSNGGEETFEVIDPRFHEAIRTIPAGYRAKVRKLGIPEAQKAVQSITYNVHGNNARINLHSTDNSINVVQDSGEAATLIAELRRAVDAANLPPAEKSDALELIEGVEDQFSRDKPQPSIVRAMLSALPDVANIANTVSALIALAS